MTFISINRPSGINRKVYYLIGKFLISGGLLAFLFFKINISNIYGAVKNADMVMVCFCFIMMFLNLFLQYIKWKLSASQILGRTEERDIFLSLFYGLAGGAFTPARLGEYWGRNLAIKDKTLVEVTAATIIDKLFPLIIVLFSGFCCTSWYYYYTGKYSLFLPVTLTILIIVSAAILLAKANKLIKLLPYLNKFSVIRKHNKLVESVFMLERKFVMKMFFISACFIFCYILQYAVLVSAFSHNLYIGKYLLAGAMVMFSKTLLGSVSFSELGIREGASVFFLTAIGESAEIGFNASIFLFVINVAIPSVFGLITMAAGKNGR